MSNNERMMASTEEHANVNVVPRSFEGSTRQFGLDKSLKRTLSTRKPESAAKPPKFRTLEKSASVMAQASYDAEIAKKVEHAAGAAPKLGMKRLERLGKFRLKSGHLDFDVSSIRV